MTAIVKVSPDHDSTELESASIDKRIEIAERRTRGWLLDQARLLEKTSEHSGFVLLMIAVVCVEQLAVFLKGESSENHSREFFCYACERIFARPNNCDDTTLHDALSAVYSHVRCGITHTGLTTAKVTLTGQLKKAMSVGFKERAADQTARRQKPDVLGILVNPHLFLDAVEGYYNDYFLRLRNPDETLLRENFERAWHLGE